MAISNMNRHKKDKAHFFPFLSIPLTTV